ncbi:hypothetical protein G6O69_15330 [Pseudenhygromyxa sp. WMMC2535]|uniref:hypothetical protein n=1 Tax=Pseudenhygromyxa sp. WMMC2535 TaxID=2712867 RepID=UPI0015527BC8|nr:hypothetical protein [Pseudenhygromyxa sp. WMMC2535]NVB39214.1 hypothetical protein [Pseudenhygromyxa sp. WMMC2535]
MNRSRHKTAFVPWLAALLLGATAHAGLLIHELREDAERRADTAEPRGFELDVDVDVNVALALDEARLGADDPRATATRRGRLDRALLAYARRDRSRDLDDLDLWIHPSERYTYTVDRRVLERVASAELDNLGLDARSLDGALATAEPIELRNIRAGTPLHLLGLRTGDRVLAVDSRPGAGAGATVVVLLERRGRGISLTYELV